jgi:hypothetical protein
MADWRGLVNAGGIMVVRFRPKFSSLLALVVVSALILGVWASIPAHRANLIVISDAPLAELGMTVDGVSVPLRQLEPGRSLLHFRFSLRMRYNEVPVEIAWRRGDGTSGRFTEYILNGDIEECTYLLRFDADGIPRGVYRGYGGDKYWDSDCRHHPDWLRYAD